MSRIDDELLNIAPDSQAVEIDDDPQYEPETKSQVVVTEPFIISVGRGKRLDALRKMRTGEQGRE